MHVNVAINSCCLMFSFLFFSSVDINSNEGFLQGGQLPSLTVQSAGHTLHVFINGQLSGMLAD